MNGFFRGWNIAKASLGVLRAQPKLMVLPICSGIAMLAIIALTVPLLAVFTDQSEAENVNDTIVYLTFFGAYIACYFAMLFFNAALIFCAIRYFETGATTLGEGLAAAGRRALPILIWALIAGTIGLILRVIGETLTRLARKEFGAVVAFVVKLLTAGLYGLWLAASYFTLPVLVVEGVGPINAVRRSTQLIKAHWGDVLGGQSMLGLLTFLAILLPGVAVGGVVYLLQDAAQAYLGVLIGVGIAYIGIVMLVSSVLGMIFLAGVYLFTSTGKAPEAFGDDLVRAALKTA
ncbi:Formate hydrogenlyase subunit 3/Multisubunit Na+/H+ antiporter MnhD subunit [Paramagnetospirillum magnetotacticum MS-1]|uniref:Formate hydrogenlyase subunit 3/Multisubunit Na+/H+ antiporter MnhD subunit n=1 Tax=Paramagnetospirillum magnetotacticum MS-1 TaxID=272627 RepID=A0A0C2YD49_PARME|nr:DUF6159 family protein [Paramagnetospirillum magnetotacticum]KIL97604.1 Formate hydrogenlyase subunit 3/Multisubunit Na+/H+ antiporter MnhD subunit [Paramagnetospirillum magnetotacticum MS-1]